MECYRIFIFSPLPENLYNFTTIKKNLSNDQQIKRLKIYSFSILAS